MKLTKKTIILGLISITIIFSIAYILNNLKFISTTEQSTDSKKIKNTKYTLNDLPKDIIKHIKSNRITSDLSKEEMKENFKKCLYKYTSLDEGLDKIPKNDQIKGNPSDSLLTQQNMLKYEECVEDINYLFTNLKYGYPGYEYFGGDDRFNKSKSKILKEINQFKDENERIETIQFNLIVIRNLKFIKDGHFIVNYMPLTNTTYTFMNINNSILKDRDNYYIKDNNKMYSIVSIEEKDPSYYIKPSLDDDGKIIYKIVYLKDVINSALYINMVLNDEESEILKKVKLKRVIPPSKKIKLKNYIFKKIQGIPIFKVTSFGKELKSFQEDGLRYSDENIAILDLRGNKGGAIFDGCKWISNFTNNKVDSFKLIKSALLTKVCKKRISDNFTTNNNLKKVDLKDFYAGIDSSNLVGWSKIRIPELGYLKNDKIIIVLFDKNTASASENMISTLSKMDNTIFIGMNSAGALNIPGLGINILPNSKLTVQFGSFILMEPDFVWRDGIGYFPDFWVESDDALDKAIRFINNYIKK
ncbi:S41 family peptidase [Crassaminicella indica]|uniref:Tail specific protease domain-containing protein n=1 Tax=Crassaminicella indica TaxID=2855394 RepID=A0ABX8RB28_9CLOT|nr:S41 family peptidase [Crassaminicella indica]QXM06228.1 hypothetical protein KVH43_12920 [Crassaminicella indica]